MEALSVGDLIRFCDDMGPFAKTAHINTDNMFYRARKNEVGVIYMKGERGTRFKVYTSGGRWAEVTNYDLSLGRIEIITRPEEGYETN